MDSQLIGNSTQILVAVLVNICLLVQLHVHLARLVNSAWEAASDCLSGA
jgi:hypothetical protein